MQTCGTLSMAVHSIGLESVSQNAVPPKLTIMAFTIAQVCTQSRIKYVHLLQYNHSPHVER